MSLPKFVTGDQGHKFYLNLIWVTALRGLQPHWKAYGGMTACERGVHKRISEQNGALERASQPTLHYTMMDLPGTVHQFYIFARYPGSGFGIISISEVIMIAVVVLNCLLYPVQFQTSPRNNGHLWRLSALSSCPGLNL